MPHPSASRLAVKLLQRAKLELRRDDAEAARRTLQSALALAPVDAGVLRWLGMAEYLCGRQQQALARARSALGPRPAGADLHAWLGFGLLEAGKPEAGLAALREACRLAPNSAAAWYNLGKALQKHARLQPAIDALQRSLALDPRNAAARVTLAMVWLVAGDIDASVRAFREALKIDPGNAWAWYGLSNTSAAPYTADELRCLGDAFAHCAPGSDDHILLAFALAKGLECTGDYTNAFHTLNVANGLQRARAPWDAQAAHAQVEAIVRTHADWHPSMPRSKLGHAVILIASIPRSGSTLVEQILASHPDVEGGDEIKDLGYVIERESERRGSAFPAWVPTATPDAWERLGREYLARTAHWHPRKPRLTDKNLHNWHYVGAALAMLPAARVVVVRRDPMETCLACYRKYFQREMGFTYDLRAMATYCADFLRLTRFWLGKFPGQVFDMEYETLVREPEPTIHRLLDFCDLPFESACLEFYKTPRAVLSVPSAAQVRQPIRRDTARAARYGHLLDGLRQQLRDAGIEGTTFADKRCGGE